MTLDSQDKEKVLQRQCTRTCSHCKSTAECTADRWRKPGCKACIGHRRGIAGIQTALDIAEAGYLVDIVEKEPTIGGKMTQIDKTFPTLDCSSCILTPKMVECAQNENITIYLTAKSKQSPALSATSA